MHASGQATSRVLTSMPSKTVSVFFVVYFLLDFINGQRDTKFFREDYTYIESEESFYKVHKTAKTFSDAKQTCALEGAILFYAEDVDEAKAVISFWNRTQPDIPWVFVGLSDIKAEGLFETVDGRPIAEVYSLWQLSQPDNLRGEEDCVLMELQGTMNDYLCDYKSYFICKKNLQSIKQSYNSFKPHLDGQRNKKFFRKDYYYIDAFESFYKIHTIPQTWADAKRLCALEGATFWHPDNNDEANELLSFWNKNKPNIEWMYVGLSDLLVEGVFETVDGKSISEVYNNWQPGQPDDYGDGQDCVYIYLKEGPGYLDDYACDKKYSFICKKTLQSLEWNHQCNMPNLDYTYNKDNGNCYKLHTTPMNWDEAYAMCQIELSHLAVISNNREAVYLAKLTESTPKPRAEKNYQRGIYHLGFHNKFNEGWQTVTGTRLTVNRDAWFEAYQPEGDIHEKCGSMFFNGRLVNTACDMRSFFICEHDGDNLTALAATNLSNAEGLILQPYFGGGIE